MQDPPPSPSPSPFRLRPRLRPLHRPRAEGTDRVRDHRTVRSYPANLGHNVVESGPVRASSPCSSAPARPSLSLLGDDDSTIRYFDRHPMKTYGNVGNSSSAPVPWPPLPPPRSSASDSTRTAIASAPPLRHEPAVVVNFFYTLIHQGSGAARPAGSQRSLAFRPGHASNAFACATVWAEQYGWKGAVPGYLAAGLNRGIAAGPQEASPERRRGRGDARRHRREERGPLETESPPASPSTGSPRCGWRPPPPPTAPGCGDGRERRVLRIAPPPAPSMPSSDASRVRIAVVGDDREMRELLREALGNQGYAVRRRRQRAAANDAVRGGDVGRGRPRRLAARCDGVELCRGWRRSGLRHPHPDPDRAHGRRGARRRAGGGRGRLPGQALRAGRAARAAGRAPAPRSAPLRGEVFRRGTVSVDFGRRPSLGGRAGGGDPPPRAEGPGEAGRGRRRAGLARRLLQDVWGEATRETAASLEVMVARLRRKLERPGGSPVVRTVRGYGLRGRRRRGRGVSRRPMSSRVTRGMAWSRPSPRWSWPGAAATAWRGCSGKRTSASRLRDEAESLVAAVEREAREQQPDRGRPRRRKLCARARCRGCAWRCGPRPGSRPRPAAAPRSGARAAPPPTPPRTGSCTGGGCPDGLVLVIAAPAHYGRAPSASSRSRCSSPPRCACWSPSWSAGRSRAGPRAPSSTCNRASVAWVPWSRCPLRKRATSPRRWPTSRTRSARCGRASRNGAARAGLRRQRFARAADAAGAHPAARERARAGADADGRAASTSRWTWVDRLVRVVESLLVLSRDTSAGVPRGEAVNLADVARRVIARVMDGDAGECPVSRTRRSCAATRTSSRSRCRTCSRTRASSRRDRRRECAPVLSEESGRVRLEVTTPGRAHPGRPARPPVRPLYRAPEVRPERDGHGLGLALARHVARLHGGDVQCVSAESEDARFALQLPAWSADPAAG